MAVGYAYTLFCDRPGCRAKQTIEGTRNAAHARGLARLLHRWRCDKAGDFCPADSMARATAHATTLTGASQ